MVRLLKTLLFWLCLVPLNVFSMDVCRFDTRLAESFVSMMEGDGSAVLKTLQFIKDNYEGLDTTECDNSQRKLLRKKMEPLVTASRQNGEFFMVLRRMEIPWNAEELLADEDAAALNLFREYVVSKYIWKYVVDKGYMLKGRSNEEVVLKLLSELSNVDFGTLLLVAKNGVTGVVADFLINESSTKKNREHFLNARIMRYSGSLVAGRSFLSSIIGSVPEVVTVSLPIRL